MQQSWHRARVWRKYSLRSRCTETWTRHGTYGTCWLQSMLGYLGQHIWNSCLQHTAAIWHASYFSVPGTWNNSRVYKNLVYAYKSYLSYLCFLKPYASRIHCGTNRQMWLWYKQTNVAGTLFKGLQGVTRMHSVQDEEHILLDCPHEHLVSLRTQHRQLVFPPQYEDSPTRLRAFLNQPNVYGVANFVAECLALFP